jgi:hypothetical protein
MRPRGRRDSGQKDLFRARLDQIIDMSHPLAKLARSVDWEFLETRFGAGASASIKGKPKTSFSAAKVPSWPTLYSRHFYQKDRVDPRRTLADRTSTSYLSALTDGYKAPPSRLGCTATDPRRSRCLLCERRPYGQTNMRLNSFGGRSLDVPQLGFTFISSDRTLS